MSATLRYDIGPSLGNLLYDHDQRILELLGAANAHRWKGVGQQHWLCTTFAVKLPSNIGVAVRLYRLLSSMPFYAGYERELLRLKNKVRLGLGLPDGPIDKLPVKERPFAAAIAEKGDDLDNWMVYADWLEEYGEGADRRRAAVIHGWLGPKPIKVKYGVPVLALES